MQIPEKVRAAILMCGMTAADWRRIRDAFEQTPELLPADAAAQQQITETLQRLIELGEGLEMQRVALAEERNAAMIERYGSPIPEKLDELEAWQIERIWKRDGHLGVAHVAQTLGVGKTTLYRRLPALGISEPAKKIRPRGLDAVISDINAMVDSIPTFAAAEVRA